MEIKKPPEKKFSDGGHEEDHVINICNFLKEKTRKK
jgi:hypothetical protein